MPKQPTDALRAFYARGKRDLITNAREHFAAYRHELQRRDARRFREIQRQHAANGEAYYIDPATDVLTRA